MEVRAFIITTVPEANELIWDNYNAVAIAYSKSEKLKDAFCHIAAYSKHVNFGFNRGSELKRETLKLAGNGKLIRHLTITDASSFPREELQKMIWEAVSISEERNKDLLNASSKPKSLVMSISPKKVRPRK